ncbi:MAG TPA: hypothetical protein VG733_14820, partial [Chthoniobacteraceae bacterium]|nr:hypothetical protein [Chthoniobacteraceae bacterium]
QKKDAQALRALADYLRSNETQPIIAPWWQCPALAYWSGQPTVAGSSHESMPGIVDTARFYVTTDYEEADKIVRAHDVQWVIAFDPNEVLQNSSMLLNEQAVPGKSMGSILYYGWHSAPPFLEVMTYNQYFKVFRVQPEEDAR